MKPENKQTVILFIGYTFAVSGVVAVLLLFSSFFGYLISLLLHATIMKKPYYDFDGIFKATVLIILFAHFTMYIKGTFKKEKK